jgi:D-sedoheptulose 7-phosphate isomerase
MNSNFYLKYFKEIKSNIDNFNINKLKKFKKLILSTSKKNKKILIFGNGGSAATASHFAVDMTKNAGIRCLTLNEYDLITCFSNDFGYEKWVAKSVEYYADKGDMIIFLSCSGNSMNIVNACRYSIKKGMKVVTLTGIQKNNKVNKLKSDLSFWINSKNYNIIEISHFIILLSIIDEIIISKKNK